MDEIPAGVNCPRRLVPLRRICVVIASQSGSIPDPQRRQGALRFGTLSAKDRSALLSMRGSCAESNLESARRRAVVRAFASGGVLRMRPDTDSLTKSLRSGDLDTARQICDTLLSAHPHEPRLLNSRGIIAASEGDRKLAYECFRCALHVDPTSVETHLNLGQVLLAGRDLPDAIRTLERAVSLDESSALGWQLLGAAWLEDGSTARATHSYSRALQLNAKDADSWYGFGRALVQQGDRPVDAVRTLQRALELGLDNPRNAQLMQARVLLDVGELEAAASRCQEVLQREPNDLDALAVLIRALLRLGRIDEVTRLEVRGPVDEHPEMLLVLAKLCFHQGDSKRAIDFARRALRLSPKNTEIWFLLSLVFLQDGNWRIGWRLYEARREDPRHEAVRKAANLDHVREWQGENLSGRRVYVYAEQGLGDTLQFVRYVRELVGRGANVVLGVQEPLVTLISAQNWDGVVTVRVGTEASSIDFYSPLLSLPHKLRLRDMNSSRESYLQVSSARASWIQDIPRRTPRIGFSWQGNPDHPLDRIRSVNLEDMLQLLRLSGCDFVSLQKGATCSQLREHPRHANVIDADPRIADFADTAAVVANLDLVVTIDSAVAHLSGALGVPTWILVPHLSDWRWGRDEEDSYWYPTVRLIRRDAQEDWSSVMERVLVDVRERFAGVELASA